MRLAGVDLSGQAAHGAAQLVRVRFESCAMAELDLQDAALDGVELADCDLTGARLAAAPFAVRMTVSDALAAVETVAAAAGIELLPDGET